MSGESDRAVTGNRNPEPGQGDAVRTDTDGRGSKGRETGVGYTQGDYGSDSEERMNDENDPKTGRSGATRRSSSSQSQEALGSEGGSGFTSTNRDSDLVTPVEDQ